MQADLSDSCIFQDQEGNIITANKWDESYSYVEPYTGITLEAVMNAQANLLFDPDPLFSNLN